MVDYCEMSDFEINGLIAMRTQKVGDFTQARGLTFIHEYGNPVEGYGALCLGWKEFDPCNNPAEAWPIISENKISLIGCVDMWIATPDATVIDGDTSEPQAIMYANSWKAPCLAHSNPLRAAMIVFLMMQDAKNG